MWEAYRDLAREYRKPISLAEERHLISRAQKGCSESEQKIVLHHISFVIFRIRKKVFPEYQERFGEDLFAEAVFVLYKKVKTYNLRYRDRHGNRKPVKFASYVWKRIDGFIIDSLKKELEREKQREGADLYRFKQQKYRDVEDSVEGDLN